MINMAIILNSSIDEDNVQEVLDIVLNKYLESDDLVSSSKKLLKEKYNDYKKYVPYDDYDIGSFNDFAETAPMESSTTNPTSPVSTTSFICKKQSSAESGLII